MRTLRHLLVVFVVPVAACGAASAPAPASTPAVTPARPPVARHLAPDTAPYIPRLAGVLTPGHEYRAVVELEKGGEFELLFYPEVAPNHVASFVSLARRGYFDGVTFHRVLDHFMAQGGDPTGTGHGGPGYTLPAEFSALPHNRGTVSAARQGHDVNSAGSQFFLCFERKAFLDFQYTVYGEVARGMEVVDGLRRRNPDDNPPPTFPGDAMKKVRIREFDAAGAEEGSAPAADYSTAPPARPRRRGI